jgi:ATP-dependent protease ClpP protease subunit
MNLKAILSIIFIAATALGATVSSKPLPAEIDPIITLTENNHAVLRGPVTSANVYEVTQKLADCINKRGALVYPIYLVLDTPGGSVDAGFRLYEFLKTYDNVHTLTLGSYSMGAVLVEMLPGKRLMVETGTIMFHPMQVLFPERSTLDQLSARTKYLQQLERKVISKIADRTGIEFEKLSKLIAQDLFLSADEALEQNFVDKIVPVRCSKSLLAEKVKETVSFGGFLPDIQIERSACPLL